ncbi:MAG TPA: cytochrome c oxidase subunit II [Planctomycetaceae bacterium]|nr:cytochrome c oxidase subunit II [Planctomycetaceae bacterium]
MLKIRQPQESKPVSPTPSHATAAVFAACLSGCVAEHPQSILHPVSPAASTIAWLWWAMFAVCTAVFLAVIGLLLWAVFQPARPQRDRPPGGSTRFIVTGGIVVPWVILVGLLVYSLQASIALRVPESDLTIRVVGHQWWWEVHYPGQGIVTANELHLPAGEPVRLELSSADVIHSIWVPNLNGKMDLLPQHFYGQGRPNVFWLEADQPGAWRGQCAEYCGLQHARMALEVVALSPDEFSAWVAARQRPHSEPATDVVRRGRDVFFSDQAGCQKCHTIRGTAAIARIGPDLTHIAARRTLGAALLPNNRTNLAGWIADPQKFKPGNLMPRTNLGADDLEALVAYLETLK